MVIPPMLEISGHGRLVSSSLLSLECIGWINSIGSNSLYGIVALFDVNLFGFVFDSFVFELGERTIFRVRISLDFVFFGAFSVFSSIIESKSFYSLSCPVLHFG